jgi:hypothetical protein
VEANQIYFAERGWRRFGKKRTKAEPLHLGNGLNQALIQHDKVGMVVIVDGNVGQADEGALIFIDDIRDTVAHGRDDKITYIGAIGRTYLNAGSFRVGHVDLRIRRCALTLPP